MAHAPVGSKENYAYWRMKYCVCSPKWINTPRKALNKFLLALENEFEDGQSDKFSLRGRLLAMQEENFVSQRL